MSVRSIGNPANEQQDWWNTVHVGKNGAKQQSETRDKTEDICKICLCYKLLCSATDCVSLRMLQLH